MKATNSETGNRETEVNLFSDTVGAAAWQVGLVVTLGMVAHYASALLFEVVFP